MPELIQTFVQWFIKFIALYAVFFVVAQYSIKRLILRPVRGQRSGSKVKSATNPR